MQIKTKWEGYKRKHGGGPRKTSEPQNKKLKAACHENAQQDKLKANEQKQKSVFF